MVFGKETKAMSNFDLVKLARQRIDDSPRTHWEGCERDHRECLIQRMADEIERLRAECLRLNHAEAEAMSVVLSLEGMVERLRDLLRECVPELLGENWQESRYCTHCRSYDGHTDGCLITRIEREVK
jgi:hypothetical protein